MTQAASSETEPAARRPARLRVALAGPALAAGGTAAVLLWNPFADRPAVGCPLHALTGLDCPGCGLTRAWWFLAHGDVLGTLQANVFFLPVLLWAAAVWFAAAWPARAHRFPVWLRTPAATQPGARVVLCGLVLAFTVLRNLPAFGWLAPPTTT